MIVCPSCRNKEMSGAIYCSECGTLLEGIFGTTSQGISRTPASQLFDSDKIQVKVSPPPALEAEIALCVVDTRDIILLQDRVEFTLGRSAEGQPILPDIDLAPYQAYENGVSRLHASVKIQGRNLIATDLGSVNGTRLNGQKIPPHKPFSLNNGDILTLGKLKLQVVFRH